MGSLRSPPDDLCPVNGLQNKEFGPFTMILKNLRTSMAFLLIFTAITGALYPILVTGIAQLCFPAQANGSLIVRNGETIGSELIGQPFTEPQYFWSRPSATPDHPYNASASSGSNMGPLNPALLDAVRQRVRSLQATDSSNTQPIPVDLVTASGSGLDPHISVMAALYQLPRVARARALSEDRVRAFLNHHTEGRQCGILGEPRVNVLRLNIALDEEFHRTGGR